MNRAGLTSFLGRLQGELAGLYPASITIAGHTYTNAATSGLQRERDLVTGGWLDKYKITFIVPVATFAAVPKPVPKAREYVTVVSIGGNTPAVAQVVVESAPLDATGTMVTLRCESIDQ